MSQYSGHKGVSNMPESDCALTIIIPSLSPGGAETVMVRIANALAGKGIQVTIVAVDATGPLRSRVSAEVRLIDLGCRRVRQSVLPLLRVLRKEKPRRILSTLGRMNMVVLALRPFFPRCSIYVREANTPSVDLREGRHMSGLATLYKWLYPTADLLICQSKHMAEDTSALFPKCASKIVEIQNPVPSLEIENAPEINSTPFESSGKHIVYCGRLARQKGVDTLLDAMAKCKSGLQGVTLHLVGDGPDCLDLKSVVHDYDLGGCVRFHGYREDRYRFLAHADLVVLPSRWEGLPNVLLEAIYCGTPVIATNCPGGSADIVQPGINGWLVPTGDPVALGMALVERLEEKSRMSKKNMRDSIAEFSESAVIKKYMNYMQLRPMRSGALKSQ